jgi:hypothetical protein
MLGGAVYGWLSKVMIIEASVDGCYERFTKLVRGFEIRSSLLRPDMNEHVCMV